MGYVQNRRVGVVIENLERLSKELSAKELRTIHQKAAKIIIDSARAKVDVSKEPHTYVKNGKVIATFYPGNLQRSIGIVRNKKTNSNITWVGPRLSKRGTQGDFKGARVHGWYGHFVEYGVGFGKKTQPYMRPAYEETKQQVIDEIIKGVEIKFQGFKPKR